MSELGEGFPIPEGAREQNILDRETLLALLAASGIAELTTSDGNTTIHIDSTPKEEGELYVNPDGKPVYGFMTKFSEGFTGWRQGDLVRARFVISPLSERVAFLVAHSYVDGRHADEFILEGDQDELAKLRDLGKAELDADVEVTSGERDYIASNMFRYMAHVDRVHSVLVVQDDENKLTPDQIAAQEALHASLNSMIDGLASRTDPADFRQQYGKIIKLVFPDTEHRYKDPRTAVQQKRMAALVNTTFDESSPMERPILAATEAHPSVYIKFEKEFGVDLCAMSVSEVYALVMEIAHDPSKLDPKIKGIGNLYDVTNGALTPEQMSTFANTVIDNYYSITVRQGKSFDDDYPAPGSGKVPSNWHYITQGAILKLSQTKLESDILTLTTLFENSVADDLFAHAQGEHDLMPEIIGSIFYAIGEVGSWTPDKEWHKVNDRERLQLFTQTVLPRLTAAMGEYTTKIDALPDVNNKYATFNHDLTFTRLQRIAEVAAKLEALTA